jgi:hypothetical protein
MPRVSERQHVGPIRWLSLGAAALVLLAASPATAQTSPPTILPSPDELPPVPSLLGPQVPAIPPAGAPTPPSLQPGAPEPPPLVESTARPPAWSCTMELGMGWDENIDASIVEGPSSWGGVVTGNLSYLHYRPGRQVRLSAEGSGTAYRSFDVYNRPNGGAGLDGRWRLSSSASMGLTADYRYGHTDNSDWLVNQGLLYGLSAMQTYTGSAALSWRVGSRTWVDVAARGVRTDFEAEELSTSDSVRTSVALRQEIGKRDGLGIESAWERTAQPERRDSLFLSLQWRHTLSPRTGVFLEGGASQTTGALPNELARNQNFYGGASVGRQVGGRSVVNASYRREVVPAFGIGGVRLIDRLGLSFSTMLGRSWFAGLDATYVIEPDPTGEGSYTSGDGEASLGRRLGRYLRLSLAGRYRRSRSPSFDLRESYRIDADLTWEPTAR